MSKILILNSFMSDWAIILLRTDKNEA
jgi:hypothetical protein